jgi:hypothetical protein
MDYEVVVGCGSMAGYDPLLGGSGMICVKDLAKMVGRAEHRGGEGRVAGVALAVSLD